MNPAATRIIPFATWILMMTIQSAMPSAEFLGIEPEWGYALRTVVVGGLLGWLWRGYAELHAPAQQSLRAMVDASACGLLVFGAWIWLGPLVRIGTTSDPAIVWRADGVPDPVWLAFRLVGATLVVPVMEELFWRSLVARRVMAHEFETVSARALSPVAVVVSSVLFALEHREIAAGFVAGVAYAWIYRRRGDLRDAIVAHAVTNGALAVYVLARGAYSFW